MIPEKVWWSTCFGSFFIGFNKRSDLFRLIKLAFDRPKLNNLLFDSSSDDDSDSIEEEPAKRSFRTRVNFALENPNKFKEQ